MNETALATGHNLTAPYDVETVRRDFPILSREVYGKPLVYLDSGASAQKPRVVIDTMTEVLENEYANVHRGVHYLSQCATDRYEAVRGKVAGLINAATEDEIVFTRGGTESINLVAQTWGRKNLVEGDEVVVTAMEHHANIVPWQLLGMQQGVKLKVAPIDDDGNFLMDEFEKLIGPRTKLVAVTHVSNVLGTVLPLKEIARIAHANGALLLVDGCQGVTHLPTDVQDLDVDFYVFSGHKLYGPNAIGVLYGKMEHLVDMPPYQGGGDMIAHVTFEKTSFKEPPLRFEAGTPPIVETIGLGAAIDYVQALGIENIAAHEHDLTVYAMERLGEIDGLNIHGKAPGKTSIVSFSMDQAHAHDIGTIIDRAGVATRTGHHCAEPLMDRLGVSSTVRASFGLYNTTAEVDALVDALQTVKEIFG